MVTHLRYLAIFKDFAAKSIGRDAYAGATPCHISKPDSRSTTIVHPTIILELFSDRQRRLRHGKAELSRQTPRLDATGDKDSRTLGNW
jgi:hypothetical protein